MGGARHALDAARGVERTAGADRFQALRYGEKIRILRKACQKTWEIRFLAAFGKAARHAKRQIKPKRGGAAFRNQECRQPGGVAHQARRACLPQRALASRTTASSKCEMNSTAFFTRFLR